MDILSIIHDHGSIVLEYVRHEKYANVLDWISYLFV